MADGDPKGKWKPGESMIEAWLAGNISDADAARVEDFFDEHPELLPIESPSAEDAGGGRETGFESLGGHRSDPVFREVIDRLKRGPGDFEIEPMSSASDDGWRDVLTPSDDENLLGMLGEYEVLELIAVGGMGIVFKARDPRLNRLAALKVLAPDLAANATARQRFLREARAAARLEHENVLPIYGVVEGAMPWFAMRYIDGGTLQDRLDAGEKFDVDFLKLLARQAAAALEAAHAQGLVHRDIKPANILFDRGAQQLWICDFGIARSAEDPSLTYPGSISGTPRFMSPEQADGRPLDGRSDLFSLGAVLHRCALGEHIFSGQTTASVLRELGGNEPTKIIHRRSDLPLWFKRLLNSLLARDPDDRPESAAAVVRAVDDEYSPPPKHGARRKRRLVKLALISLFVVLLVAGFSQMPPVERAANRILASRHQQAFFISGRIGAFPDLKSAVAAARNGQTIELPIDAAIMIDHLLIGPNKALTLVSAVPGSRPRLATEVVGAPGLTTRSPLTLLGLDFEIGVVQNGSGILIVDGASLSMSDCNFFARRDGVVGNTGANLRVVELRGDASADVSECDFDVQEAAVFTLMGQNADLRLRDSRLAGLYGVDLVGEKSAEASVTIDVDSMEYSGQTFLRFGSPLLLPRIEITAQRSVFNCARPLCWIANQNAAAVLSKFSWSGVENFFPLGNAVVQVGESSVLREAVAVHEIGRYADPPESDQRPRIVIESTGEEFSDLGEAVRSAPKGAKLLLSGRIECAQTVNVGRDQELQFHADPSYPDRPTVVATHRIDHALFILGPTVVKGIRFVRYDAEEYSFPVCGVRSGDSGPVLIEDCEFYASSALPQSGRYGLGFSVTETEDATLKRCIFRCGRGMLVSCLSEAEPLVSVTMEECVFVGHAAVEVHFENTNARLDLSARRCLAVGSKLIWVPYRSSLAAMHFAFENSVVDVSEAMISISDKPLDSLRDRVLWRGQDNFYRQGVRLLTNPHQAMPLDSYAVSSINTFEQMEAQLPSSSDAGSRFGDPVKRALVGRPVLLMTLWKALHDAKDSEAAESLLRLAR